jgi:glycerophosphoryl diester phosphodiesterase
MSIPGAMIWKGREVLFKYHRLLSGSGRYAPNSLSALEEVLDGARVIEFDIQPLADEDFVLLHDPVLEHETTGSGPVARATRKVVKAMRLRGSEEPPALLSEAVEILGTVRRPVRVQVDFKPLLPVDGSMVKRVLDAIGPLRSNPMLEVVVGCLADWNLRAFRRADPTLSVGFDPALYLDVPVSDALGWPVRVNAYGYMDDHPLGFRRLMDVRDYLADRLEGLLGLLPGAVEVYLRKEFVQQALRDGLNPVEYVKRVASGVRVDVWTVNLPPASPGELAALLDAGVDQLTTDTAIQIASLWRGPGGVGLGAP